MFEQSLFLSGNEGHRIGRGFLPGTYGSAKTPSDLVSEHLDQLKQYKLQILTREAQFCVFA